ncbi:MAG: quinolinate synthase NadA, partial [Calditrichales bacterium]
MPIQVKTLQETYEIMRVRLSRLVPEIELKYKAELAYEINRLKLERSMIILGHNYMEPALYISVPDIV